MSTEQTDTLHGLFRAHTQTQGDAPAVRGLHAADLSYRGLIAQFDGVARALNAWGIGRGDRVLIRLANGPAPFVAAHAVAAAAVAMLVDPNGSAAELEHFIRFIEPKAIVLEQGAGETARALAQQYGVRVLDVILTPEAGAGSFHFADDAAPSETAPALNGPDDLAYLMATSGTTSVPKLVPKTQRVMLRHARLAIDMQVDVTGVAEPMDLLNFMPLHMAFALNTMTAALVSGGSAACMPGFDPEQFFDWLDRYQPYYLGTSPAIFAQLLALAPQYEDVLRRYHARYIVVATSMMPDAVRDELYRTFNAPLVNSYGATEIGRLTLKITPVGAPLTPSSGVVVDADRTRIMADGVFLPANEQGEIVYRSDDFTGYWNNPEANAEVFWGDWFRVGDIGRIDADGNLTILGRVKEIINSGGAKISPYEVELILRQHPEVTDAVVFGIRHAELGETVAAAVVGSTSERALRKFASERLPFYKVPMRIIMVDAIPVLGSGKITRNRLAELLGLQ